MTAWHFHVGFFFQLRKCLSIGRIFQIFIWHPDHHRYAELLRRCQFTRRAVQVLAFINWLTVVSCVEHNRFLIANLINHAGDKVIHIGHRVVIGVDHLRFGTAAINTNTFRLPLREATRITLGVVKMRTFGMQNDQMLTIRVAP